MLQRTLGRTGFSVSALGLGCYQYTSQFGVLPEEAYAILDYAIENGINLYDTAQSYSFGESEELLGRAKARHPDTSLVISTKLGNLLTTTVEEIAKTTREMDWAAYLDPIAIKRAVKHSMWLLQVDQLDMLMIHEYNWKMWKINFATGEAPVVSALQELKKEGIIDLITWRLIQRLGDIRNLSVHAKDREPSESEIQDLISGCEKLIAELI